MLIIEHHAEQKLTPLLHQAWLDRSAGSPRYLYFPLHLWRSAETPVSAVQADLLELATAHIRGGDVQLYLLREGDALLLAEPLPRDEANALVVALAARHGKRADEQFYEYQELRLGAGRLLAMLETRALGEQRARLEAEKQQAAARQAARRAHILGFSGGDSAGIPHRRTGRDHAELMVIEDDVFSARLVEGALRKHYPVTTLHSAEKALQTYCDKAPDMVLLDINLPDVDGHALLEGILRMDPEAYVVMLSAHSDAENVTRALQRGAKGFVTKPFSHEKLMQYVQRCPTLQH